MVLVAVPVTNESVCQFVGGNHLVGHWNYVVCSASDSLESVYTESCCKPLAISRERILKTRDCERDCLSSALVFLSVLQSCKMWML